MWEPAGPTLAELWMAVSRWQSRHKDFTPRQVLSKSSARSIAPCVQRDSVCGVSSVPLAERRGTFFRDPFCSTHSSAARLANGVLLECSLLLADMVLHHHAEVG